MHTSRAFPRNCLPGICLLLASALACDTAGAADRAGTASGDDAALTLTTQPGIGAPYGSRDPRTCASKKAPAKGPPSVAQATAYFICHVEGPGPGDNLYLVENVRIEVGKGTPFLELDRGARPSDGDVDGIVYQIRGSFVQYQCARIDGPFAKPGKNCTTYDNSQATGTCFRTNFGDWTCNMIDFNSTRNSKVDQAPPKAKA